MPNRLFSTVFGWDKMRMPGQENTLGLDFKDDEERWRKQMSKDQWQYFIHDGNAKYGDFAVSVCDNLIHKGFIELQKKEYKGSRIYRWKIKDPKITLRQLIPCMDTRDEEYCPSIQVVESFMDWDKYNQFRLDSEILDTLSHRKIDSISAEDGIIRVGLCDE